MAEASNEEEKGGSSTPRSDAASRLAARRAAKAAAKASKKGTAPVVPGAVAKQVQAARSFYEDNARLLLGGIGAGLLAAVLWMVISAQMSKKAGEGAAELYKGVEAMNGMVLQAGQEPPEDSDIESFASAKARAEKAHKEFEATAKAQAGSAAGLWAVLGEANTARELGKPADAAKLYEQLIANKDSPEFVKARATEGLGFALEAQQKYADALKRFEELAKIDKGAYKPLADYHSARMHMALGEKQKAADVLEALVKAERARPPAEGTRYENVVADAETLLTELSVELNAPKLRADIPGAGGPHGAEGGGTGLTQDIVDALRKQLESGKGGSGVSKEVLDALEHQVQTGQTSGKTVQIPVGKSQSPQGQGTQPSPSAPAEPK
jgi:tetratricopeptide (TPR) repeat protein